MQSLHDDRSCTTSIQSEPVTTHLVSSGQLPVCVHSMQEQYLVSAWACTPHIVRQTSRVCAVQELIRSGADDVKSKALQTAGNLAFCHENRHVILEAEGFREIMVRMADPGGVVKHETRMSAIRALAILGALPCPALVPALPCPALPCPALPVSPCPVLPCPAACSLCPALALLGGLSCPCPALPCPALPLSCPALPCPALPCPALPCPALPCPALPCPALPCPALLPIGSVLPRLD